MPSCDAIQAVAADAGARIGQSAHSPVESRRRKRRGPGPKREEKSHPGEFRRPPCRRVVNPKLPQAQEDACPPTAPPQ